jgi:tetratricopeptide (TPR) repeat protein
MGIEIMTHDPIASVARREPRGFRPASACSPWAAIAPSVRVPVWIPFLLLGFGAAAASAQSPDRVIASDGTTTGEVVSVSPLDVEVTDRSGEQKKIPIEKVREVQFNDEPQSLKSARVMLTRGRPAEAIQELAKIEASELEDVRQFVLDEIDFVKAAGTGRAALAAGADPAEGAKLATDFLAKHPKSHHFFRMQELLGDLLSRAGKYDDAQAAYAQLDKGPAALKVRAAAAKAAMFFDQKKFDEAFKEYEKAVGIDANDEESRAQKRMAELGKARCLTRQGEPGKAIELLQNVIKQANPEEKELLARTYIVLGESYRTDGGKDQDALISYLTVDLVYNSVPDSHAEALYNLMELWERGKNPERSREARESLQTIYPGSPWAKKAMAGGKS